MRRKRYRIRAKKPIFKKPLFWLALLTVLLVGTGAYFLVFFEKFQISKIVISGNEKIQSQEIERIVSDKITQRLWFGISSQSIFLVNPGEIKEFILSQYPNIGFLGIKRKLPNAIMVDIKERKAVAVFCDRECFFIDEKGVIFEKTSDIEFFLVVRQNGINAVLGKESVKKEIMEDIVKIQKDLGEKFQVSLKEAEILSEERLNIKTSENWEVYFNLASDMDLQITKLTLLLEKEVPKESRLGLKYIDLRFERAYLCDKKSPCAK